MPRPRSLLVALALVAVGAPAWLSCGEPVGAGALPALPANLDVLDPQVARTVRDAHAALRSAPDAASSWGAFGYACEANGMFAPAARGYTGAAQREPRVVRWRYRAAVCHAQLGRFDDAFTELEAAVALDPGFAPTHVRHGELLLDVGESERARASLVCATQLAPGEPAAWWGLARAELELDALPAAIAAARRALELRPDEPYPHHLLGTALRRAGRAEEARAHLAFGASAERTALDPFAAELTPWRAPRARRLDEISRLTERGQHAQALPLLEALLADEPDSLFALNKLALALGGVGRPREALPHLARALELEPDNLRASLNLALMLAAAGDADAALAQLERTLAREPGLARAHELKGRLLRDRGRFDEALPALERAVELDGRNAQVWIWIGSIQVDRGDWSAASASFERALDVAPASADALALLAVTRARTGREDEAAELLRRAEALAPRDRTVLEPCRRALAELGIGGR